MSLSTRTQSHIALLKNAEGAQTRTSVRLSSPIALSQYIATAAHNAKFAGAVEDMALLLAPHHTPPTRIVRTTLSFATHITDLTLNLHRSTPLTVFRDIHFPQLVFLKTNLPHATLLTFLPSHRKIRILLLGACNKSRRCPLTNLDLDHIEELQCPLSCAPYAVGDGVQRLTLTNARRSLLTSDVFHSMRTHTGIYQLRVDVLSDDYALLASIRAFTPGVRYLTLIESAKPSRTLPSTRRAWNSFAAWSRGLRALPQLEDLAIRTSAHLIPHDGHIGEEEELVSRWVTGKRNFPKYALLTSPIAHRQLARIALWYAKGPSGTGIASYWYKNEPEWKRVVHIPSPNDDELFF